MKMIGNLKRKVREWAFSDYIPPSFNPGVRIEMTEQRQINELVASLTVYHEEVEKFKNEMLAKHVAKLIEEKLDSGDFIIEEMPNVPTHDSSGNFPKKYTIRLGIVDLGWRD